MGKRKTARSGSKMARAKSRKKGKQNRAGMFCISGIAVLLLIVMSIQIIELNKKDQKYLKTEEQLEEQIQAEEERAQELMEYEQYMESESDEYVEGIARSKFGLVYPNEIIFQEQE